MTTRAKELRAIGALTRAMMASPRLVRWSVGQMGISVEVAACLWRALQSAKCLTHRQPAGQMWHISVTSALLVASQVSFPWTSNTHLNALRMAHGPRNHWCAVTLTSVGTLAKQQSCTSATRTSHASTQSEVSHAATAKQATTVTALVVALLTIAPPGQLSRTQTARPPIRVPERLVSTVLSIATPATHVGRPSTCVVHINTLLVARVLLRNAHWA